ncbi:MAG: cytochrome C biogenesis protein [Spirochaetes bacterium RBG_13_51_14]|nr:MAG: cytochrome C biogenesis protein [Spirochaetes bacterium RBG_13_51_14]
MEGLAAAALSAIWLGILTSISPCPLATNIAAVSYLGRQVENTRGVIISGLFYTLGRMTTYAAIGVLIVVSMLAIPDVSNFLQKYMNKALGPVLIVAGMFLLGLISFSFGGGAGHERVKGIIEKNSIIGSFLLGLIFALSFCPVSAALFFGALVPLAVKQNSSVFLPILYGAGTALPVIIFALFIEISADFAAKAFHKLTAVELWFRRVTGIIFILMGVYFSITFIFKLQII